MAHHVRHDRDRPGSVPLRRVVRQRPLTEDELAALYGGARPEPQPRVDAPLAAFPHSPSYAPPPRAEQPYLQQPEPEPYAEPSPSLSPPGVVRPAEWTDDVAGDAREVGPYNQGPYAAPYYQYEPLPASAPPPAPWVPREHFAPRTAYVEEEPVAIPMRRARVGWAIVALIVLAAAALLGYALIASDVFDRVTFGAPELSTVEESAPVERDAIDVGSSWVVMPAKPAAAEVVPAADTSEQSVEPEPAASPAPARPRARRPEPNRTYTYQRSEPAVPAAPPANNPYPDVQGDRSLDRLQQQVEQGISPPAPTAEPRPELPPPPPPTTAPEAEPEPPADLKMPDEYRQSDEDIIRDPGF